MNPRLRRLVPLLGPAIALGSAAAAWIVTNPHTVRRAFLVDVAVLALATGAILVLPPRVLQHRHVVSLMWLACGALLIAAMCGPLTIGLWVAIASLAVAATATRLAASLNERLFVRLGLVAGGAVANGVLLWALLLGGYRPLSPTAFEARPLRVHTLLSDVPLHDAWEMTLRGGGADRSVEDVLSRLSGGFSEPPNAAVAGLFAARALLGLVFSLDDGECSDPARSYVHRLSEDDRTRSRREPEENGVLYVFEREALLELVNCTVHAFIVGFVEPGDGGQRLIVGVYVKENRDITPYYMTLIDPFRRLIVYPVIIDHMERYWAKTEGDPLER